MSSLHNEQDLALAKVVDLLVRTANVAEHCELLGLVVEHDRIVRRHEVVVESADEDGPRALADQLSNDVRIVRRVMRVVAHESTPRAHLRSGQTMTAVPGEHQKGQRAARSGADRGSSPWP